MLLPGLASAQQACVVAHKVLAVCSEPFALQGQALRVGLSAGMALFPQHGASYDELARNADAAMYAAKRSGRMQVRRYAGPGWSPRSWRLGSRRTARTILWRRDRYRKDSYKRFLVRRLSVF